MEVRRSYQPSCRQQVLACTDSESATSKYLTASQCRTTALRQCARGPARESDSEVCHRRPRSKKRNQRNCHSNTQCLVTQHPRGQLTKQQEQQLEVEMKSTRTARTSFPEKTIHKPTGRCRETRDNPVVEAAPVVEAERRVQISLCRSTH